MTPSNRDTDTPRFSGVKIMGAWDHVGREDGFGSGQQDMEDYVTVRATASWQVSENFEVFGRVKTCSTRITRRCSGSRARDSEPMPD